MKVKLIKLNTGEELVASLDEKDLDLTEVELKNPVMAFITPDGSRLGFLPFPKFAARSSDRRVVLDKSFIMLVCDLDEEVENQYNANYGSGLVVPPSRLI